MKAGEKKSEVAIETLIDGAKALATDASNALAAVHSKELRHLPVPRSGFEAQVKALLLADAKGGISLPGQDPGRIEALLARAEKLKELIAWLRDSLTLAETHLELDRANAWKDFLARYAVLSGLAAAGDGTIETAIAPIVDFMSYGPRPDAKKADAKVDAKNSDAETPATPDVVKVKDAG